MDIILTDLFKQEFQAKLGIREKLVHKAITTPDFQDIVELDELVLGFFVTREVKPEGETYLLVCTRRKDSTWFVDSAFIILPDLVSDVGSLEPLALLQGLAQRCGLVIRVGRQLNKFIFRELITTKGWNDDPAKLVEVINPSEHSFVQSMHIRIEPKDDSYVADVALAYCIDTDEYLAWLSGNELAGKSDNKPTVEVAPQLNGTLTPRDAITPSGTLEFKSNYSQIGGDHAGILFRLSSKMYSLEIGFTRKHFYIARNDQRLEWLLEPVARPAGNVHCFAMWEPAQLSLLILDETFHEVVSETLDPEAGTHEVERRRKTLITPVTIPPNSLLEWAREESIAPVTAYESAESFYENVISSIQSIVDKVSSIGMHNAFWDITYDGQKIVSRKPKRETDIHPTIHGLLFDIAIAKNFLITPEYAVAGGQLDFLVSGALSTGDIVSTCIEFKHAHSSDYLNGLLKQLPAYMHANGSDSGIYCVMYFKGPYFTRPEEYDLEGLKFFLVMQGREAGLSDIRIIMMDFSHQTPPSKL